MTTTLAPATPVHSPNLHTTPIPLRKKNGYPVHYGPPCGRCGTTEGKLRPLSASRYYPVRCSGKRFGMEDVVLCHACYQRLSVIQTKIKRVIPDRTGNNWCNTATKLPLPHEVAARAQVIREEINAVNGQESLWRREARQAAKRREHAELAERERMEARAGRQRAMVAMGARFYA